MEQLPSNNVNDVAQNVDGPLEEYPEIKSFKTEVIENDAPTLMTSNSSEMEYNNADSKDIVFEQAFIKCEIVDDEFSSNFNFDTQTEDRKDLNSGEYLCESESQSDHVHSSSSSENKLADFNFIKSSKEVINLKMSSAVSNGGTSAIDSKRNKHKRPFREVTPADKDFYECVHCTKRFKYPSNLKNHSRIHTGEKPFKCSYCMKEYSQPSTLKTHLRTHTGERPFTCTYCMKSFNDSSNLKNHVRIHTGEKPYECTQCMKRFKDSSCLRKHINIHIGDKPNVCRICEKRFKDIPSLRSHLKTHL